MEGEEQQQGSEGNEQQEGQQERTGRTYSQADMDRITSRVRRNAQSETEARVRREYAGSQQQSNQQQQQGSSEKKAEKPEPKREDFNGDEYAYVEARAEWKADQAARRAAREEREILEGERRQREATERAQERDRTFKQHSQALAKEIPDFLDAIQDAHDVPITTAMGDAMQDAGALGPRILYYLVKHPEEAERISGLKSKREQEKAIDRIETKIENELESKKAKGKKDEGEEGEQEEEQQSQREGEEGEEDSEGEAGEEAGERDSETGRFKATEKKGARRAPDPIEPGSSRGGSTSLAPSDKDSEEVWMKKRQAELARDGKAARSGR